MLDLNDYLFAELVVLLLAPGIEESTAQYITEIGTVKAGGPLSFGEQLHEKFIFENCIF